MSTDPVAHVLFLRREDNRALENLSRFLEHDIDSPGLRIVIDKTRSNVTKDSQYPGKASPTFPVEFVRRPHSETLMQSVAAVDWPAGHWIVQVHDDDRWLGFPVLPSGLSAQTGLVPIAASPTPTMSSDGHSEIGLIELFFGAVHPEVWRRFGSLCRTHELPSPGLDLTLGFWLSQIGIGEPLEDYCYQYDNSNWSSSASSIRNQERFARDLGWGELSGSLTLEWTNTIDQVTSLTRLDGIVSIPSMREALIKSLTEVPPFYRSASVEKVAEKLPIRWRWAMIRSRRASGRAGRFATFAGDVFSKSLLTSRKQVECVSLLLGDSMPDSPTDRLDWIAEALIPGIRSFAQVSLAKRCDQWAEAIRELQLLIRPDPPLGNPT